MTEPDRTTSRSIDDRLRAIGRGSTEIRPEPGETFDAALRRTAATQRTTLEPPATLDDTPEAA